MDQSQAIAAFSAMAQDTRLEILRFLVRAGPDGSPAGGIGAALSVSSSRLSFHLATLERAGLVSAEKVSRQVIYRASFQGLGGLARYILEDCCSGNSAAAACCVPGAR